MPSGGARGRSGPPPDPSALRRDRDAGGWTVLPAAGRDGEPPKWPLSRPLKRELQLWAAEWARPQAVEWERNGQDVEVAFYVRTMVAAEKRDAKTNLRTLVRQQQDALGISLPGLQRNRWRIGAATAAAAPETQAQATRTRFKVVTGGAG